MKVLNVIITVMVAALVFSTYLLVLKIMPKSDSALTQHSQAVSVPQDKSKQQSVAREQSRSQVNSQAPTTPVSEIPMPLQERPALQHQTARAPQIKDEPTMRPVHDIKVVMYMTDW